MRWDDVTGHAHVTRMLGRQLSAGRLPHALLFEGPEGVGRKRMALALAAALNCETGADAACGACASCRRNDALQDPGLLVFTDVEQGLWVSRRDALGWAGGEERLLSAFAVLLEAGFVHPPVPTAAGAERWDRIFLSPEKVLEKPGRTLEELSLLGQDEATGAAARVGAELYRVPSSVVYYRRSLGIDRVRASEGGEGMRTVQGFLSRRRLAGRRKVVVLDDAHKMTEEAQNSLLKTLEEPPGDSLLVLVLDASRGVLPTIRSRCQSVRFGTLPPDLVEKALMARGFAPAEARWAAARSGGLLAEALSLSREDFLEARSEMLDTWGGIWKGDAEALLNGTGVLAHDEIGDRGLRVRRVRGHLDALTLWLRDLLFAASGAPRHLLANPDLGPEVEEEAARLPRPTLERAFEIVTRTARRMDRNVDIRLALEGMALELAELNGSREPARG